ncbi:hypothetical protein V2J09_009973 [Rumex salicifolius]
MVVFSLVLWRVVQWLVYKLLANTFYKLTRKIRLFVFTSTKSATNPSLKSSSTPIEHHLGTQNPSFYPILSKAHVEKFVLGDNNGKTIVCDLNGALLRSSISSSSSSFFPFFMLVAFEGGSVIRAFLLLLSYPFSCLLISQELKLKVMVFITFFGLRVKDMESVARTVLPKFYLEDLHPLVYEMWASAKDKVVITSVPKVMVEWFAKEYLEASQVIGSELQTCGGKNGNLFFSGFVKSPGLVVKHKAFKANLGDARNDVVGLGISSSTHDHLFLCNCKESFMVNKDTITPTAELPRSRYPKPLIFHDGRLAFLPTPSAAAVMLFFFPLAVPLAVFRLLIGCLLPPRLSLPLGTLTGVRLTLSHQNPNHGQNNDNSGRRSRSHVLYVSNHRTLLDPVMLGVTLQKPLTAVTYSLSRLSEIIAPIPTARLTRDRHRDGLTMRRLLEKGDLVVCPEGTTCREPYLLRYSSLFAELTDEIVPVAVEADVSMFYGTTASGSKWLDPIFFFMNPSPGYAVRVLEKVAPEMTCGGGGRRSVEVANWVQAEVGRVLGFECTQLTRKDKYMMLAGNEGLVAPT